MKVAISNYPLKSGHKDRGVGVYTQNLIQYLNKKGLEIVDFENIDDVKDVDLIHYTWFDIYFNTLKIRSKIPTVVTIHDVMPLIFKDIYPIGIKGQINLFLQRRSLAKVAGVLTVSQTSKEDITQYLNFDEQKITVTYESVDSRFRPMSKLALQSVKSNYHLPDRFLLYVGDANFVKNLPFLIKGFRIIKRLNGFQDLKLILVGKVFQTDRSKLNHPELKSLKETLELIKLTWLNEEVILPGFIETQDLVGFYNLASAYIQPSLYEGFGIPVLEAMSCGIPVISSSAGSLPEVGGEAPLYFDPQNMDEFLAAMETVLQNDSLRDKLKKKGLEQAANFSWEKTVDETIKLYQKVT